jgi:NAD(P)-dependent dehydrogenase (short-subunit alcohol dehydrogenase family)
VDAFDELFKANVRGAFVLAQTAARRWREAGVGGHLIFTSSWVQDYPWPEIGPYCASKAAMYSLMRSFAKELAPYRIRANAVLPGIVSAGMARRQWDEDPDYRRRAQDAIALGELQDPRSVADAFAFLCSAMASYMTGAPLLVDGGCALRGP